MLCALRCGVYSVFSCTLISRTQQSQSDKNRRRISPEHTVKYMHMSRAQLAKVTRWAAPVRSPPAMGQRKACRAQDSRKLRSTARGEEQHASLQTLSLSCCKRAVDESGDGPL